jgi:type IV pilus assembly protein PilW
MSKPFSPTKLHHRSGWHYQAGLSLIELMIAIALGMLVVAAVLAVYINVYRANNELAKANSQIENGRFAMQILENDVVHAGYWGIYVPPFDDLTTLDTVDPSTGYMPGTPIAAPDPCLNPSSWAAASTSIGTSTDEDNLIGIPVQAYAATPAVCASVITNPKSSTDVLVVRHVSTCSLIWNGTSWTSSDPNCEADNSSTMYFQAALCKTQTSPPYVLAASASSFNTLRMDGQGANCPSANLAEKRKYISNLYYIRNYSVTPGDGIPTLMRSTFAGTLQQSAQPLVEGIEGFHVELGIDNVSSSGGNTDYANVIGWVDPTNLTSTTNRGDGVPDSYVSCPSAGCTVAQLRDVVAVRIYVLARAKSPTTGYTDTKTYNLGSVTLGPFNDSYKRHVFSTTIRLKDVSGRREAI